MQKLNCFLFMLMVLNVSYLNSQIKHLKPELDSEILRLEDSNSGKIFGETSEIRLRNYNPIFSYEDLSSLNLSGYDLKVLNVFTCYFDQQHDGSEQLVWSMNNGESDNLILTNLRLANAEENKFVNFQKGLTRSRNLFHYQHSLDQFDVESLLFNNWQSALKLPVKTQLGSLGEIIVFDTWLSPQQKQRIDSYLAIKYVLDLDYQSDLSLFHNEIVWDLSEKEKYNHRICGLVHDQAMDFHQKQCLIDFKLGKLSIGLADIKASNSDNLYALKDGQFLLLGDNNADIFYNERSGELFELNRTWQIRSNSSHENLALRFTDLKLHNDKHYKYYLAISETEGFNIETTRYVSASSKDDDFIAHNQFINDGTAFIKILTTPDFLIDYKIEHGQCESGEIGAINFKALDVEFPLHVNMKDPYGNETSVLVHSNFYSIELTESGNYQFEIVSANGLNKILNINHQMLGLEDLNLEDKYFIENNGSAHFDFSQSQYEVSCQYPDGEVELGKQFSLKDSGTYKFIFLNNGCESHHSFELVQSSSIIESSLVYPNPSTTGFFTLESVFNDRVNFQIVITDLNGREIYRRLYPQQQFISEPFHIAQAGLYNLQIIAGNHIVNHQIVIQ